MPSEEHEPPTIPQAPACTLAATPLLGSTPWDKGRAGLGLSLLSGCVSASRVQPWHPPAPAAMARSAGRGRRRAAHPAPGARAPPAKVGARGRT